MLQLHHPIFLETEFLFLPSTKLYVHSLFWLLWCECCKWTMLFYFVRLMGRGKRLSEYERSQIQAMCNTGDGIERIARAISQSVDVIQNFFKDPGSCGMKKDSGRPPELSVRDKREIIRKASNLINSLNQIRQMFVECFKPYHSEGHPRVITSAKSQTEAVTESQEGRQASSSFICPWKYGSQVEWGKILL
jgi:hypothetical protein